MGEGNHYLREIPCYICGSLVPTTSSRTTCPECRAERKRENNKKRYNRRALFLSGKTIKVIYDPIPYELGGFGKDAEIGMEDLKCGLSMHSFIAGTIFMINGIRKEVTMKYKLKVV
jgi:hypothetical protein